MRVLLDSHVVLWWLADDERLGASARAAIADADEAVVSVVTAWELGIKRQLGKLEVPDDYIDHLVGQGFVTLPITLTHAIAAPMLPLHHRDPFDRMLIAQARAEAMTLVSADGSFRAYDVDLLDAAT